jgi:hypothetical protein
VGCSYAANYQIFGTAGAQTIVGADWKPKYNIGDVPDGLSNTVFIAERFAQQTGPAGAFLDPNGKEQQANNLWAWPANYGTKPPTSYATPVPQNAAIFGYFNLQTGAGYGWAVFDKPQVGISPDQADYRRVNSGHSAKVVQVSMGDGSVHGVSPDVSQPTWQNALTPADGVPLGKDWNY